MRGPALATEAQWAKIRHFGAFVAAGTLAFITDVLVFQGLHALFGLHPLLARPPAILVAMVVSWLINRTMTFAMPGPPRLSEFLHFATLAAAASAFNYAIFVCLLWLWPPISATLAIGIAAIGAMLLSYVNMRFSVFRRR